MQIYVLCDTAIPSVVFVFHHSVPFVLSSSFDKYLASLCLGLHAKWKLKWVNEFL